MSKGVDRLVGTNNLAAYHRANPTGDQGMLWQVLVALADTVSREDWDAALDLAAVTRRLDDEP